ncbi:MAG: hypothetical protein IAA89_01400, partial [Firmicutes bacterium]|nr:hypothetical protein [Candidatus Gallilactobacillus intestinavium]
SALLTAAPLLGNVTANAATTNNNTTSSSAKVSSSSLIAKESSKVSATSSSKAADKKAARSAVRANNFAEAVSTSVNNNKAQNLFVKPADVQRLINSNGKTKISDMTPDVQSSLNSDVLHNTTVVPNVYGQGFEIKAVGGMAKSDILEYNGQPFTGYDVQDNVFWDDGVPYTLTELQQNHIQVPQSILNQMKQIAAKQANNSNVRLANGQTIRTYGYNHYVANVNARTLPKTGESNSIISLLKALF